MINFPSKPKYDGEDLRAVVEILRGEGGCPWDREQTHETLRRNLLEEADELCEAIDRGDAEMLKEELGDVWLQVLFHASIEQERGRFTLEDVADAECRKLIYRHPHVFGDVKVSDLGEELRIWEDLKRSEKRQKTSADAMDAVCRTLPGLWRAEKLQKKAAHGGPETESAEALCAALHAQTDALAGALTGAGPQEAKKALGELLYTAVRAARLAGVDPEEAVHGECEEQISSCRARESAGDRTLER